MSAGTADNSPGTRPEMNLLFLWTEGEYLPSYESPGLTLRSETGLLKLFAVLPMGYV